ncbi:MAG: zinc metalloprotease HtpX [Candidatus Omnitrophota bacterium]|nr:zinc metalloprotease HtpX [Candidatus Omnitrophota bacterium]
MFSLKLRMSILVILLFAILYAIASVVMYYMGIHGFLPQIIVAVFFMLIQYFIGPKIVEISMRVKYIKKEETPWLFDMVADLSRKANIPMPRIGISYINIPNAFAFGRGVRDGRVCVTKGIMDLLSPDELRAVLGHEISHLKNRDVLFITLLSVVPMLLYMLFFHLTGYGSYSRRRENSGGSAALIGIAALLFYFITNLLVLYASRIREYFADKGSLQLGNSPATMATALYKLVYGAARTSKEELKQVEGLKAFFINDVSRARNEIAELASLDLDRSGTIDPYELRSLKEKRVKLNFADKAMEILSTHPNMLKRIKQLSQYSMNS